MTKPNDGGLDLAELRKLAEKATPGPWANAGDWVCEQNDPGHNVGICTMDYRKFGANNFNAAYIAAANPQTIIALLDLLAAREAKP